MRLGLTSAAFYGRLETEDAAARLNEFPVDVCEIFLETRSEYTREFGCLVSKKLSGLPCRAIHAKGNQFEGDLYGASKRQQRDAFDTLDGVLSCGQALGAKVYVFHGQPDLKGGLKLEHMPRLHETVGHILDLAKRKGISVAWENVSWCALKQPKDAVYLRKSFPGLSFVLDIKQAYQVDADPFAFLEAMGEKLIHVHVLDYDAAGRLCLPGQGLFDFCRLRRELDFIGYRGDVILEPYASQTTDEKALTDSILYLLDIFG